MLKIRLFLTALIFWLCVLLINLIRPAFSDINFMRNTFLSEKISWKNRFDLVLAGDSRTLTGISPQAMQSVLPGYKIGNLGFAALIYSQEYMDYIRNALSSSVKNRVIVIGFSPRSLLPNEKPNCFFRKWNEEAARIPLKMELNRRTKWLQALFRELSVGDFNTHFIETDRRYLLIFLKSGWVASRLFPEKAKASKNDYRNYFKKGKIDEELLEIIYRNTKIWTREGIKVFSIRMPIAPNLFMIEKERSGFEELNIRERFEKNGGIWLNPAYNNLVAFDGSHLRYDSAVAYSKSLAKELKKFIGEKQ
jgi:hypothetical protein